MKIIWGDGGKVKVTWWNLHLLKSNCKDMLVKKTQNQINASSFYCCVSALFPYLVIGCWLRLPLRLMSDAGRVEPEPGGQGLWLWGEELWLLLDVTPLQQLLSNPANKFDIFEMISNVLKVTDKTPITKHNRSNASILMCSLTADFQPLPIVWFLHA